MDTLVKLSEFDTLVSASSLAPLILANEADIMFLT